MMIPSKEFDVFNEAYCDLMLSTPPNSPARKFIINNAAFFEKMFTAGMKFAKESDDIELGDGAVLRRI